MKTSYVIIFAFLLICSTETFSQTTSEVNTERKNSIKIITKEKLLSMNSIEEILDGFPNAEYEISEFKLSVTGKQGYSEFASGNNQLSNSMKEKIKSV